MANEQKPCGAHEEAIKSLQTSDKRQWDAITNLQNRPPVWCTLLMSLLTFALGFTLHYALTVIRVIGAGK